MVRSKPKISAGDQHRPERLRSLKVSPYILVLVVILLIGYGRFFWPIYANSGDWSYPNLTRSLFFSGWLPLFSWIDLNSYTGIAFYSLISPLVDFLRIFLHLPAVWSMTVLYFWLPVVLAASGMWRLVKELTKDQRAAFWASLVYTVNAFILTILIGGHLNGAVAYSSIPWIIWGLQRLTVEPSVRRAIILSLWLALQGIYEPRYLLITGLIILAWLIALWWRRLLTVKSFLYMVLGGIFFVLISFFWIYGAFFIKGTELAPAGYTSDNWLKALSFATVWHAVLLHHVWWPNRAVNSAPSFFLSFLPIISLATLFSRRWIKLSLPLWILALVGILLTKGSNPPGGEINVWIFLHLPGFSAFRDPAKFFTIIGFAYSILFGLGVVMIYDRVRHFRRHRAGVAFILFLVLVFSIAYRPLWLQKVRGTFVKRVHPIVKVNEWFTVQSDYNYWYRVFWWPTVYQYITFDGHHSPVVANDNFLLGVEERLPGLHEWIVVQKGDPRYLGYLINAYGARYIAVPGDTKEKDFYQHNYEFTQNQYLTRLMDTGLFNQKSEVVDENGQTTHLFSNPRALGQVFTSKKIIITDTPDSSVFSALADPDPLNNSLVFYDSKTATQDGINSAFAHANETILNINYDTSQLNNGYLAWPLTVPADGDFHLLLPTEELNPAYTLDDQPLIKSDTRDIGGQKFAVFEVKNLIAGQHQIKTALSSLDKGKSLITPFPDNQSVWIPCLVNEIGTLDGLYEESNRQYFHAQSKIESAKNEKRCLQVRLPLSQGKHYLLFNQDVKTDNPQAELYLNFIHIEDYHLPFSQMKGNWQLLATTARPFTQATLALVIPASEQTTTLTVNQLRLYDLGIASRDQMILESDPKPSEFNAGSVTLDDQSPERKTITIKDNPNGLVLTFSDQYHIGWQLIASDGKVVDTHFSTLLKQNAWFVPAGMEGKLELVFRPTKSIKIAAYFSLLVFISLMMFLLWRRKSKV